MAMILLPKTRELISRATFPHELRAFGAWLSAAYYTPAVIHQHLSRLRRTLEQMSQARPVATYTDAQLQRAFGRNSTPQSRVHGYRATQRAYRRFLLSAGRLKLDVTPDRFAALRRRYDQHLVELRGFSRSAREANNSTVADFLNRGLGSREQLSSLTQAGIERFVALRSKEVSRHSLQHVVGHLRSFLRYCYECGATPVRLDAIDTPRTYRGELPPRAFAWATVQALLRSIDRASKAGERDYAILHLLAHYGLRPTEIATLRLDSIDWRARTLRVEQSKTRSVLVLPLAHQTTKILRRYLDADRGWLSQPHPELFLRARCPHGAIARWAIGDIFRKRCREGNLTSANHNVYRLRHTFAMQLLRRGVGIKAIGDVLGHRSLESTCAYLRLDIESLREAALPVPRSDRRIGGHHA